MASELPNFSNHETIDDLLVYLIHWINNNDEKNRINNWKKIREESARQETDWKDLEGREGKINEESEKIKKHFEALQIRKNNLRKERNKQERKQNSTTPPTSPLATPPTTPPAGDGGGNPVVHSGGGKKKRKTRRHKKKIMNKSRRKYI